VRASHLLYDSLCKEASDLGYGPGRMANRMLSNWTCRKPDLCRSRAPKRGSRRFRRQR
jgi:hypothetical protein